MIGLAELSNLWHTIGAWLFSILEDELGEPDDRHLEFIATQLCWAGPAPARPPGQRAARWPGVGGEYLRQALLRFVLAKVGRGVVVSYGSVISKPTAELEDGAYIGAYCVLGDVRVGVETLIADHVCVPSGSGQHGITRLDAPIRQQEGEFRTIRIGSDCWIGSGAVILADVGQGREEACPRRRRFETAGGAAPGRDVP